MCDVLWNIVMMIPRAVFGHTVGDNLFRYSHSCRLEAMYQIWRLAIAELQKYMHDLQFLVRQLLHNCGATSLESVVKDAICPTNAKYLRRDALERCSSGVKLYSRLNVLRLAGKLVMFPFDSNIEDFLVVSAILLRSL
jgi:hypothetical protein